MIPGYIPDGLNLREIYRCDAKNCILYQGSYVDSDTNELLICIEDYSNNYADMEKILADKWIFMYEKQNVEYYQFEESYKALWGEGTCIYTVEWISLDEIYEIIGKMK